MSHWCKDLRYFLQSLPALETLIPGVTKPIWMSRVVSTPPYLSAEETRWSPEEVKIWGGGLPIPLGHLSLSAGRRQACPFSLELWQSEEEAGSVEETGALEVAGMPAGKVG